MPPGLGVMKTATRSGRGPRGDAEHVTDREKWVVRGIIVRSDPGDYLPRANWVFGASSKSKRVAEYVYLIGHGKLEGRR